MAEQKDFSLLDDWEMQGDFYDNAPKKELKLEDFMTDEEPADNGDFSSHNISSELKKVTDHVKVVRELMAEDKTISDICAETGLEEEYVTIIEMTLYSMREDCSDEAIAHLVMMG